jgi:hypothetical protein
MDSSATTVGAASTDSAGRYHIDSLPPGRYAVGFESPLLDSLELHISPRTVDVGPGKSATIDLALPPSEKLLRAHCPGVILPSHTGVIFGHVVDAANERPVRNAVLGISWEERDVDRATLRPVYGERIESATTDGDGWYRLCGVPTDTWLSLELHDQGRVGPVIRALVDDTLGIAVRHLSVDASALLPDSAAPVLLSGTAMLSGVVRGTGDVPVESADISVRGARATAKTDARGRYSISGLPAGTQMLDVRRVGYSPAELSVELRSGTMVTGDVRLRRIVNLDSIRVVATRQHYSEFTALRQRSVSGIFLDPDDIAAQGAVFMTDVIRRMIPGIALAGTASNPVAIVNRGPNKGCREPVILNGIPGPNSINDFALPGLGAIAVYQAGDIAPGEAVGPCGAIMIWTRR